MKRVWVVVLVGLALAGYPGSVVASPSKKATQDEAAESSGLSREEFQKKMKTELAEIESKIGDLKENASQASDEAQAEFKKQIKRLEDSRMAVTKQLNDASDTSGRAWSKMRVGLEKAMGELKSAYKDAKAELKK